MVIIHPYLFPLWYFLTELLPHFRRHWPWRRRPRPRIRRSIARTRPGHAFGHWGSHRTRHPRRWWRRRTGWPRARRCRFGRWQFTYSAWSWGTWWGRKGAGPANMKHQEIKTENNELIKIPWTMSMFRWTYGAGVVRTAANTAGRNRSSYTAIKHIKNKLCWYWWW